MITLKMSTPAVVFWLLVAFPAAAANDNIPLSIGQTVYASIYSHVFTGPKELPFNLAATLSIRNTDLHNQVKILSAEYFDSTGRSIREYVQKPIKLAPLASQYFAIKENDETGGFGANFIVKWQADKAVNPPIIESVMIGAKSGQGISFVSQGKVIDEGTK